MWSKRAIVRVHWFDGFISSSQKAKSVIYHFFLVTLLQTPDGFAEEEESDCAAIMRHSGLLKIKTLILFGVIVCTAMAAEKESKDPLVKAFQSINAEEKTDFISYFLALGLKDWAEGQPRPPKFFTFQRPGSFIKALNISNEKIEKFDKMNIPKESRKKLLQWTKSEFNLTTTNILELLKNKKCLSSTCLPDIGELCCPW